MYIYIYIYIHAYTPETCMAILGRGDDTVGSPHRAQISRFELFELILLSKLDKHFPVEQFEATVSRSTVPSPPLHNFTKTAKKITRRTRHVDRLRSPYIYIYTK